MDIENIKSAKKALKGVAKHTPLDESRTLSELTGNRVFLKTENMQRTGSFKIRGAYNKIKNLSPAEKVKGVIAASAGNHAQGVALAAKKAGIAATVVMPETAPVSKVAATKGYGANVVLFGQGYDDAYSKALEIQHETGATLIQAFNDPFVIAGQGTIGLEIIEDLSEVDVVIVPIGGGGLVSGIATAVKALKPDVKVIGVEAEGAASAYESRKAGFPKKLESVQTIADGIAVKSPGDLTFEIIERLVDDIVTVNDDEIAHAILHLLERSKLVVEGSGAVGVAALLHDKIGIYDRNAVVILSGGNIDVNIVSRIIERGMIESGRYIRLVTNIVDRPGSLTHLLNKIALAKANVISVYHNRTKRGVGLSETEVELELETRDKEQAENIIAALESEGYKVKFKTD
jgi:threonine dehydratase